MVKEIVFVNNYFCSLLEEFVNKCIFMKIISTFF